jgi:hypothetical protein
MMMHSSRHHFLFHLLNRGCYVLLLITWLQFTGAPMVQIYVLLLLLLMLHVSFASTYWAYIEGRIMNTRTIPTPCDHASEMLPFAQLILGYDRLSNSLTQVHIL